MKYFFYIFILISIVGCKQTEKEEKPSFDKSKYETVYVGFLDETIFFPKGFEAITIDDYEDILLQNKDSTSAETIVQDMYRLKLLSTDYMLFVDKNNPSNSIWIQLGEYVDFSDSEAAKYIAMLKMQMENKAVYEGFEVELQDKRFLKTNKSKIIKAKFLMEYSFFENYMTQYIITSEGQTFSVVVNSNTAEDFEEIIARI